MAPAARHRLRARGVGRRGSRGDEGIRLSSTCGLCGAVVRPASEKAPAPGKEDDSWDSTSETIAQLAPNSTDEDDDRPLAKTDLFDHAHGLLFDDRLPKAHVKAIASALQVNLTESSPWLGVLEVRVRIWRAGALT